MMLPLFCPVGERQAAHHGAGLSAVLPQDFIKGKMEMTIRDLLKMEVCIDVIDDVTDELWIAFDGAMNLTAAGEKKFSAILGLPVKMRDGWGGVVACVMLDGRKDWERLERKCIEFFEAAAGYCSAEEWDEWFYTVDRPFGANC